eukprot:TRINITY_DN27483_c0_g1_i2.p1 TRINITY_DN27483_c0_g1~~TRINITY_DN27483_c0_g1_i2.p1  ORF type:complete len:178 (+),score=24.70 TRINITY_DN27483_c0_g1_i2:185-718(+)
MDNFRAVVDTRGGAWVRGAWGSMAALELEGVCNKGRYDKWQFAQEYVVDRERSRETGISKPGVAHVIYVDDSVDGLLKQQVLEVPVDVVELPREGDGLTPEILAQVKQCYSAAALQDSEAEVCVIYDFDCTLSAQHMFKTFYQSSSRWAQAWKQHGNATHHGPEVQQHVAEKPDEEQ